MGHATFSPSGAAKWINCPGSAAMEQGLPNPSSKFADEGTAAHFLASTWLEENGKARHYIDKSIVIYTDETVDFADKTVDKPIRSTWKVTEDMLQHVQRYTDNIGHYRGNGELYIEQRLPLEQVTGETKAYGTADAVVVKENELQVHDLKYGRGIDVDAKDNLQLIIYALAAIVKYGPKNNIRMVIHQPRKNNFPEFTLTIDQILERGKVIHEAALDANDELDFANTDRSKIHTEKLVPGAWCRNNFCRARSICPALTGKVLETVSLNDFEDLTTQKTEPSLSQKMAMIPIIEDWCKAVRGQVEAKLFTGEDVLGWKLVQGKKGNRKWADSESLEKDMLAMRITHRYIYDYKLASPTTLEKHANAGNVNGPQWVKIKQHITQAEGVPSVAPSSDKRPAISVNPRDDFDDVAVTDVLRGLI